MFFQCTLAFCCIVWSSTWTIVIVRPWLPWDMKCGTPVLYISVGLVMVWRRDISSNVSIVEPAHPCIRHICLAWINYCLSLILLQHCHLSCLSLSIVSFCRHLHLVLVVVSKRGLGKRLFVVCLRGNLTLSVLGVHCLLIKNASSSKMTLAFMHSQPRVGRCHVCYRQLKYGLSHWFNKRLLSLPMPYFEFLSSCLLIIPSFLDTTWHWWHMRLLSIVLLIVLPLLFCLSLASLLVIPLSYQCHCRCVVNLPLNGSHNEGMIFWCFGLVIICWHVVGRSMYQYIVADNNYSLFVISIDQHVMSQNECSH